MSGFSPDWLALRAPADDRARARSVRAAALAVLCGRQDPLIVDLACGTGSTVRALTPHLDAGQRWRLVDHDPVLLARAKEECSSLKGVGQLQTMPCDLACDTHGPLEGASLVTTSAFLDLVSRAWLTRLVEALSERGLPFYAALTYDGRLSCDPPHALDEAVRGLVNLHQKGEKGLGPALGPDAPQEAEILFAGAGYKVTVARSDWNCLESEPIFQTALVEGWARAADETGALAPHELDGWRDFRLQAIEAGRSRILVGHVDILAIPSGEPT